MKIYIRANTSLSNMERIAITDKALRKYASQYKQLSHVRVNKNTKGYLYFLDDKVQAMINVEDKQGEKWIQGLEIFGDAKGTGLSRSLLDVAVNELGATKLSVNKKNTLAKSIYDKYGFKVYDEDDAMYYMELDDE